MMWSPFFMRHSTNLPEPWTIGVVGLAGYVGTHRKRPPENGFVMADTLGVSLQGYSACNDFT